ncbi:hypothetical protein WISP_112061 [Willisornis vidua]|uniref:Uncharacterized protein n=1 Tax=Willisornis vidua TaxID=1566151 RepID=A0ABQ9D184_9PASS|nr:hypothetical protein WISP_112061 [Willisornis vidua]
MDGLLNQLVPDNARLFCSVAKDLKEEDDSVNVEHKSSRWEETFQITKSNHERGTITATAKPLKHIV